MRITKRLRKGAKALATLAAGLLLFGAAACSHDSGGGSSGGGGGGNPDNPPSGVVVPGLDVADTYSLSAGTLEAAYEDASLYIKFDSAPTVNRAASVKGSEGAKAVRIYSEDEKLADTIYASAEQITSQATNAAYKPINVKDQLISVNGNVVVIKLHKPLENDGRYAVMIDDGLITGKIGGADFKGISDATTFRFQVRSKPSISGNTITIGKDKNYSTIQAAFDYLASQTGNWTLEIDQGYYNERLSFANPNVNITMIGAEGTAGDYGEKTVIYWKNNNGKDGDELNAGWNNASRTRTAFLYEGKDLILKNLTIANTISRKDTGKEGTQAEAFYYDATGKLVAFNCSFKSHQDTLLLGNSGGRGWFYKCYIEGDTDFIWGYPDTVLFEECEIRCLYDDAPKVTTHTSYIFASRSIHTSSANKGLVLFNNRITVDDGVTAYYGRNSGSDTTAAVVFNTFNKIESSLWFDGSTKYDEDIEGVCSIGYRDYGNVYENGSMIPTTDRKEGTYTISKEVAEREYCGRNAILNRGWDATERVYKAVPEQWDLSEFEEEFGATEDKSKSMIFVKPTYVPYLAGGETTEEFAFSDYKGDEIAGVTLSVDNAEFATVSGASVTAVAGKTGLVVVTAKKGEASGIARINVIPQVVEAEGLALDRGEDFAIDKDDTVTLKATFTPAETTDQTIEWKSSDLNVLRVAGSGAKGDGLEATVTGFGVGTATITATSKKTPDVKAFVTIEVKQVNAVRYLQESTGWSIDPSIDHRDATIAADKVSYGFNGNVTSAVLGDSDKSWGNGGYKFNAASNVGGSGGDNLAWADFTISAIGAIKVKAITADAYCSATSNIEGKVFVKVGDGDYIKKAEVAADNKAMSFNKADITTEVPQGKKVTVRVAIALTKDMAAKAVTGVIGGVVIYYDIEGEPVPFPGADGDYNIIDYAKDSEKVAQFTAMENGSTADGMISWKDVHYHSENYGLGIKTPNATITIKVGGPSVISMKGSEYSNGTISVTTEDGTEIAGGDTKVKKDGDPVAFLYDKAAVDTLTVTFSGTTYVGTINVRELKDEKAEVKSVKVTGAETVWTSTPVVFSAEVEATYLASKEVKWSSSDTAVATVTDDGTVTGLKAGTTTITATSKVDTTKKDSVEIKVSAASWQDQAAENATWVPGATTPNVSDATVVWDNMVIVAASGDTFKCHEANNYFKVNATTSIVLYIPMTKDGTITIGGDSNCGHKVLFGSDTTEHAATSDVTYNYTTSEGVQGSEIGDDEGIEQNGTYAKITFTGNANSYCKTITRTYP